MSIEDLHRAAPQRLPMHRRGYLYATSDSRGVERLLASAEKITGLGAGELRVYRNSTSDPAYVPVSQHGLFDAPTGADLFVDSALIRKYFPYVTERARALLHTRRCGWFAAQQFGMYMFEQALAHGAQYMQGKAESVEIDRYRIASVKVGVKGGTETISARKIVLAAGPLQKEVGRMIGVELPIVCELHLKVMFNDSHHVIPRDMGLFIWNDPVRLPWSEAEQRALAVQRALLARNLAPDRITVVGYGESRPVASNDTQAGRQQNRRIEVVVSDEQGSFGSGGGEAGDAE